MNYISANENDYVKNVLLKDFENEERKKQARDEYWNILFLLFLYLLQGVPLGFTRSIPLILQDKNIGYKKQALFSLSSWPFCLKLIWAPIVDSLYWKNIGRRKSWLVPTQYILGFTMIFLSSRLSFLFGDEHTEPNVLVLTAVFFLIYFLAATQDVAVDGWALTLLSKKNVGYASTCNVVGQSAGFFIGKSIFLALESEQFCNSYLRMQPKPGGIVTVSSFLFLWGMLFLICTTLILIMKKEKRRDETDIPLNITETYKVLYKIMCLPSVWTVALLYLTRHIGFAITDEATDLKLVEAGLLRENLAILDAPCYILKLLVPIFITHYIIGPNPMALFLKVYPYRLSLGIVAAMLLWWTHYVKLDSGKFPYYYYFALLCVHATMTIIKECMSLSTMAFSATISDPSIGGTYMTLLNTAANIGTHWQSTVLLWFLDPLTFKSCSGNNLINCNSKESSMQCEKSGGQCFIELDGYYILTAFCLVCGYFWFKWGKPTVIKLQQLPPSSWEYVR